MNPQKGEGAVGRCGLLWKGGKGAMLGADEVVEADGALGTSTVIGDVVRHIGGRGDAEVLESLARDMPGCHGQPELMCGRFAAALRHGGGLRLWTDLAGSLHVYHVGQREGGAIGTRFREVAEAAGLRFRGHVIRPYLLDRLDLVFEATECFQDTTQARQADVADWLGEEARHRILEEYTVEREAAQYQKMYLHVVGRSG